MRFVKFVPITLIFIILLIGWLEILIISIEPTTMNYVSLAAFLAILILYFINVRLGLYATGIMILLGAFNLIPIFLGKFNVSFFALGSDNERNDSIKFDLRCIGLLVVYLFCTWKSIFISPVKQDCLNPK
ncbi:hypothetical protein GCM10027051_29730 [Niabella terrae]